MASINNVEVANIIFHPKDGTFDVQIPMANLWMFKTGELSGYESLAMAYDAIIKDINTSDDRAKKAAGKSKGNKRSKTDYKIKENKTHIYAGGAFMIPSGRYRWISSPDFNGRAELVITYNEVIDKYMLSGHLGNREVGPFYYNQGYEAEGAAYEKYKDYLIANDLSAKLPDRFTREPSNSKELEHFRPDPKGTKNAGGVVYVPVDNRNGKFKPKALNLDDKGYSIQWDSNEGQSGPANGLKDAERQMLAAIDRRYPPSEYKELPKPNRGQDGSEYLGCPNCGSPTFSTITTKVGISPIKCETCGCVWDTAKNQILMDLWDHEKFNKYRDGAERSKAILFPNGYKWTPWKENGQEYAMTKDDFDERFYNVLYDEDQQKYDVRTRDYMNFNKKPKGLMQKLTRKVRSWESSPSWILTRNTGTHHSSSSLMTRTRRG